MNMGMAELVWVSDGCLVWCVGNAGSCILAFCPLPYSDVCFSRIVPYSGQACLLHSDVCFSVIVPYTGEACLLYIDMCFPDIVLYAGEACLLHSAVSFPDSRWLLCGHVRWLLCGNVPWLFF